MSNTGSAVQTPTPTPTPTWEEFVKSRLLSAGVVSGVCLMSQQGLPVYSYGELDSLQQSELKQFLSLFKSTANENIRDTAEDGFSICKGAGRKTEYKVYKRTYCSIYATSPGNVEGLIISNLPHGVLLCTYRHPVQPGTAVKHIEHFCDLLRA